MNSRTLRARFLPLVCPDCSDDLVGRASDVVAFCTSCERAWRCDGETLSPLAAAHVTEAAPGTGPLLPLPFWVSGSLALPAFLGGRPISLGRLVAGRLDELAADRGCGRPAPLGARIPPESLARAARLLTKNAGQITSYSRTMLLAIPARMEERRLLLPRCTLPVYADDVVEAETLAKAASWGAIVQAERQGEPLPG